MSLTLPDFTARAHLENFETPPDIVDHLTYSLTSNHLKRYPDQRYLSEGSICELGLVDPFPQSRLLTRIYKLMPSGNGRNITTRAHDTVYFMTSVGVTKEWIQSLSFGVAMPIWEMVRTCQSYPPTGWTPAQYTFIDRADLAAQAGGQCTTDYSPIIVRQTSHMSSLKN